MRRTPFLRGHSVRLAATPPPKKGSFLNKLAEDCLLYIIFSGKLHIYEVLMTGKRLLGDTAN